MEVKRLSAETSEDFFRLHSDDNHAGWCQCVAWWVPSWDGFMDRTAEENLALRRSLFEKGVFDGYLLYDNGKPVGWCQAAPQEMLAAVANRYKLTTDEGAWVVTCFVIAPSYRRQKIASTLLREVVKDIAIRGGKSIKGFPCTTGDGVEDDFWTGHPSIFEAAGFTRITDDPKHPTYQIKLAE